MRQNILMTRGTTNAFKITVTDADGNLYTLGPGEFLKFGVKQRPEDKDCLVYKEITTGEQGVYTVVLSPGDTSGLAYGRYVYDVGLQSGEDYFSIIPVSAFAVSPNVTKWGAAE